MARGVVTPRVVSLDLIVLTPGSAPDFDTALSVYYGETPGVPDEPTLTAFINELDARYRESWPWTGEPLLGGGKGHVALNVGHESWEEVVPQVVQMAHAHGLVVLDPQDEGLYPPGTPHEM